MHSIDFDNVIRPDPLIDEAIQSTIQFIRAKRLKLGEEINIIHDLNDLQDRLVFTYTEKNIVLPGYTSEQTANIVFSQFLQYLFHNILRTPNQNLVYANIRLANLLINFPDSFYYVLVSGTKNQVTLWVDPSTSETALLGVCRKSSPHVLELLLRQLQAAFKVTGLSAIPPEFETYLFYENKRGLSALTITWSYNRKDNEAALLHRVKQCYGAEDTVGFRHFLFQVDATGNSILMKAIERKNKILSASIFDSINRIYDGTKVNEMLQYLLSHQNKRGETALHKAVESNDIIIMNALLDKAVSAFSDITSPGFKRFLLAADQEGITPLILAVKKSNRGMIYSIFQYGIKKDSVYLNNYYKLLMQQDNQGYSALMHAAEAGDTKIFKYLLNTLFNLNYIVIEYDSDRITACLNLKNNQGYTVFQILAQKGHWGLLDKALDLLQYVDRQQARDIFSSLDFADENGLNILARLYREENAFRAYLLVDEARSLDTLTSDRGNSEVRVRLAQRLLAMGFQSSEEGAIPEAWRSLESSSRNNLIDFFAIFCGKSPRFKRSPSPLHCNFGNKKYQASFPDSPELLRQEALINIMALFTKANVDSVEQIALIRNSIATSKRERVELTRYKNEVDRYYRSYGASILQELKAVTSESLADAFASSQPYILIDSGNDLLLLDKNNQLFCSMVSPIDLVPLKQKITILELKSWLDTYFRQSYSLHPFDPLLIRHYPQPLNGLESPIISDSELLIRKYEGMTGSSLQELFLLDGRPIKLSLLAEPNFFADYESRLSFRVENFPEVFFSLTVDEKISLKRLAIRYNILPANYKELSSAENEYLTRFGSQIIDQLKYNTHENFINTVGLFELAINTHQQLLARDNSLLPDERQQLVDSLINFKNSLRLSDKAVAHGKAVLQLTVLLLPSAVRSIVKKDPVELAIPVGMIASDVALRELLTKLASHPQVARIFAGTLANKVLATAAHTAERVPIIGGLLAGYGLIQSGKALITADSRDPNRSYYAHLLINNLITVGVMAAEAVVTLPFWPVLGLFAALTVDQMVTEGARIHDNVLHLQDDNSHPLLKFYRKFNLGLSIVNADIQVILEQRQLFTNFLAYLDRVKDVKGADAIVAVTLPAIRRVERRIPLRPRQKMLGCVNSVAQDSSRSYPNVPFCTKVDLVADKKEDYSFELGDVKTFCERRDPFFVENSASNYTLLVGTRSLDCSLGQETTREAMASAKDQNAAALLVNTQFKFSNQTEGYRVFLPIDPFHVRSYVFKLKKNTNEVSTLSDGGLNDHLPCVNDTVYCIDRVRVVIAKLYLVAANDLSANTWVTINDDELRSDTNNQQAIRAIEYLISDSNKVVINPNQIPEQTFAFFNQHHNLKFSDGSLVSDRGFQAELTAKKLTLELGDKAWVSGTFSPNSNQTLIINHLKGISNTEKAILNITQCEQFTVSFGKDSQISNGLVDINVEGNFTQPILEVYRHMKRQAPFYRLTRPMNDLTVSRNDSSPLVLTFNDKEEQELLAIYLTDREIAQQDSSLVFSGEYKVGNQSCFSRVRMDKTSIGWECNLEINATPLEWDEALYLEKFQAQNFNKVSVLTKHLEKIKKTHYIFCQQTTLPHINGKFADYRLLGSADGWWLNLKHENSNEETQIFLAENITQISIDNILYQVKPALAALYAVGTVDNSPIDGKNLIAPLSVELAFNAANISYTNEVYTIGNLSLKNIPSKQMIHFADQVLPFYYLEYSVKANQSALSSIVTSSRLDSQQVISEKYNLLSLESSNSLFENINNFLIGGITVAAATLSAGFFMLIKRFKRSQVVAMPIISAVPLLNMEGSSAQRIAQTDFVEPPAISQELKGNLAYIERDNVNAYHTSHLHTPVFTPKPIELNSQLVLANYLLRNFYNRKTTKPKKEKFSKKNGYLGEKIASNTTFYTQSVSSEETACANDALLSNRTLLLN
jgi:ankyrin repeat protein